jgi:hypothetical protein
MMTNLLNHLRRNIAERLDLFIDGEPMAMAVSNARGMWLVSTRSKGPRRLPSSRAKATPSEDRCEPLPRAAPFFVYEWRLISILRII